MKRKFEKLRKILFDMESVLIAYSGGVDSTFLLKVAKDVLGKNVIAVTGVSATYTLHEKAYAKNMAERLHARHLIIKTDELSNPRFKRNPADRCYWCKKELFFKLKNLANKYKLNYVLDGSNYDDIKDFRPGARAEKEFGIRSPLREAGLTKKEIRALSKRLGLSTWDKPSLACLSSRFPYGTKITLENLARINKAEDFLRTSGMRQIRVRHHDTIARIETDTYNIARFADEKFRKKVVARLKNLGYTYVTVDLEGYRTGSMNPTIRRGNGK